MLRARSRGSSANGSLVTSVPGQFLRVPSGTKRAGCKPNLNHELETLLGRRIRRDGCWHSAHWWLRCHGEEKMLQRSLGRSSRGLEALILGEIDHQRSLGRVGDYEIRRLQALAVRARNLEAFGEENSDDGEPRPDAGQRTRHSSILAPPLIVPGKADRVSCSIVS